MFTTQIDAPPEEVFRALTYAEALTEWIGTEARAQARPGGRFYLWWDDGYFTAGEYTEVEPNQSVAFTWNGNGDPGPTRVRATLTPAEGGTRLDLVHSGMGDGEGWDAFRSGMSEGWDSSLETLKLLLEKGEDIRRTRRPMVGILFGDDITAQNAEEAQVPLGYGVRIGGVLDQSAAEAAGLQRGDVIVEFGGKPLHSWSEIRALISPYRSDDTVPLEYFRDGRRLRSEVTLGRPPVPTVPSDPKQLAQQADEMFRQFADDVDRVVGEAGAEAAAVRPAPGEWSVNEILAHMILSEVGQHNMIASYLEQRTLQGFSSDNNLAVQATVESFGNDYQALIREFRRACDVTCRMVAALPGSFLQHRGSYDTVGTSIIGGFPFHGRSHLTQIEEALAAVTERAMG